MRRSLAPPVVGAECMSFRPASSHASTRVRGASDAEEPPKRVSMTASRPASSSCEVGDDDEADDAVEDEDEDEAGDEDELEGSDARPALSAARVKPASGIWGIAALRMEARSDIAC